MHCIQYINNTTNGVQSSKVKATNRVLRSVTSRLKGKDGRVRGNLCGKRVDQSARSVITPDPNISIEELGVPLRIAKTLTMPEIVRPDNMERLQETIEAGPQAYPGAIFVEVAASGSTVHLKRLEARRRVRLEVGDVVHRHLLDGDVVLFNRQPSLHRMSMMAHRVRVMPHDTFRLSVMVTPPYNADFDGDEMNAHCPQSAMTATELRMLSGVASQIITPREHKPIIGVVQDVALGIHLVTAGDVRINKKAACNLLAHLSTCKGDEAKEYSGIEMMSELFPPTLHMKSASETIEYGRLVSGRLNKKAYQRATTGVLHTIYNDNGPRRAVRLLDDTQNLSCDWLMMNGFSVGIGDLMGGSDLKGKTDEAVNLARANIDAVIQSLHDGTFKNESFMSNSDKVEAEAIKALKAMFDTVGQLSLEVSDSRGSRLMSMINAGSKGSKMNVCQMVGSVGQQEIENHRVPLSFEGRVLPHFSRYDDGGDARGLVASSFLKGLGPKEFFMHAMAGREGLIDTAVKTSETGYIQRKLIKALEDCKVSYDRSVRMANGNIVQFLYGEDGMDACAVETQNIPTMDMDLDTLTDEYMFSKCDVQAMHGLLNEKTIKSLDNSGPELWTRLEQHFRKVVAEKDFLAEKFYGSDSHSIRKVVYHPIAFDRLIIGASMLHDPVRGCLDLHPSEALDAIDSLCDRLAVTGTSASPLLMAMVRSFLSPKRLIQHYKMGSKSLKAVVATVEKTFLSSLCSPSEMVGIVAAQSIAEPLTQMVLNTFHSTGVGSATKRLSGVPRIKELIAGTKNPRTPGMTVYLNENISRSRDSAIALRDKLQTTAIGDIVLSTSLLFDVSNFTTSTQEDARISALYKAFSIEEDEHASPWMLRMVLNRQKMLESRVHMHDVHRVLTQSMRVSSVHSDDGSKELVIRLRPPATSTDMMSELSALEDAVMALTVSGISDIKKAVEQSDEMSHDYNVETKVWDSRKDEYVIVTQGSNLAEVLSLDAVDPTRTTTNDIMQINAVLGIEAARTALLEELHEGYSGESYVNYRHVALLVDFMVQSGTLMPIDRHGINRGDIGPLAKCSFEQPVDNLVRAAVFRETDKVHGVSASIMLGQVARCGTGDGDIVLDEDAYANIEGERAAVVDRFGETSVNEPSLDSLMAVAFDRGVPLPANIDLDVSSKLTILTASA
jgi:DNA-directed RNA polymerase II subunit RPB1